MIMYLDDAKVIRHFGARPEIGKLMSCLPKKRVSVRIKWSLTKLDYVVDDDVLVRPTVALKCLGKGKWEVLVAEEHRSYAELWLLDNCQ